MTSGGSESGFMFLLGPIYSLEILRGGVLVEVAYLLGKVLVAKQSIKANFPSLGKWQQGQEPRAGTTDFM